MIRSIIRAALLVALCVTGGHIYAKSPCDDIANAQQKQSCLKNEQQRAQQQTQQQAQQEAQRQAQLKAQQQQQQQAQQRAQQQQVTPPNTANTGKTQQPTSATTGANTKQSECSGRTWNNPESEKRCKKVEEDYKKRLEEDKSLRDYEERKRNSGNYSGGSAPQKKGCDGLYDGTLSKRQIACCEAHDRCYEKYGCNKSSWKGNALGEDFPCQKCNTTVKNCLL